MHVRRAIPVAVAMVIALTTLAEAGKRRGRKHKPKAKPAAAAKSDAAKPAAKPDAAAKSDDALGLVATTIEAKLHAQPGESTKVVATVPVGTRLEVLGRDGRWLRVRRGRTTGWVTRTSVAGKAAAAEEEGITPAWSSRFSKDTAMDGGDYANGTRPAPSIEARAAVHAGGGGSSPTVLRARAGLGATARGLSMSAADPTADYSATATTPTIAVGAEVETGKRAVLAGDLAYAFGYGGGGAHFTDGAGATRDVGFSTHEVDVGVSGGARFGPGLVAARLGYHYEALLVNHLDPAYLPSEHIHGPTAGVRAEVASRRVWLRAGAEIMFAAQREQTSGLEDGTSASASLYLAELAAGFAATRSLRVDAGYRYMQSRTEWTGPSMRQPGIDGLNRSDHAHAFTLGVSKVF